MKHIKSLGLKFLLTAVVLLPILIVYEEANFADIVMVSVLVTIISYAVGDRFILPRTGNLTASVADFGITFILIWGSGSLLISPTYPMIYIAFGTALIIGCIELFFHVHLEANVLELDKAGERHAFINNRYLTEFAKEYGPVRKDKRKYEKEK